MIHGSSCMTRLDTLEAARIDLQATFGRRGGCL